MKKRLLWGGGVVIVLVVGLLIFSHLHSKSSTNKQSSSSTDLGYDTNASKQLTGGACSGTGSVPIIPPMKLDQVNSIQPYGLMTGGHVTPIDHQYYIGTDPNALRDTYDVVAPADGKIVSIQHRGSTTNTPLHSKNIPSSDEYRIVFAHTCSFLTYVDLVTSLDPSLLAELPKGWTPDSNGSYHINVKQGQVIGHIGGQTLDFAVWDLSQKPLGFLVRTAYDNAEPWKVFTAPTTKFLAQNIKAATIAKYVRTIEPVDGRIDYDQEGKLVGTWFQVGTNGYDGGRMSNPSLQAYWGGHLSFAPNYVDPSSWIVSIGNYSKAVTPPSSNPDQGSMESSGAQQFGIKGNVPDPTTIDASSGLVKFELTKQEVHTTSGAIWHGELASGLKAVNNSSVSGVILLQITGPHELKVEVFPGKIADQVSAFDSDARTYNRGDDAKLPASTAH
jgi:hypothetical protein